jgi:hypothetical protein
MNQNHELETALTIAAAILALGCFALFIAYWPTLAEIDRQCAQYGCSPE